jgi:hypothetical protein
MRESALPSDRMVDNFVGQPNLGPTLPIQRIFAIMGFRKLARYSLLAPDSVAGPFWMLRKMRVPIFEVSVDSVLRSFHRGIVAVVNDRFTLQLPYDFLPDTC